MQFSHAVGYRGLAKINGSPVLCTGGSINLTQDPIMSSGVWGASATTAAPIAYAFNYLSLEGSINCELTSGITGKLGTAITNSRTNVSGIPFMLKPDGVNGFSGNGWCTSVSVECSEGSAATGSINFKGDPSGNAITAGSGVGASGTSYGSQFAGETLIAYWETSVSGVSETISWSCSYNTDMQYLHCCRGQSTAPIASDYIVCGEMNADGNYTVFQIKGDFAPSSYHQIKSNFIIKVGSGSIKLPKALISSGSTSMATGSSYVTCEFSFTALGDGTGGVISMA